MFKIRLQNDKIKNKIAILVYNNYKRFDQIGKIYKNDRSKTIVAIFDIRKFKKYIFKGLNFYNKKLK